MGGNWKKINTLVEFPEKDLDLKDYVQDEDFLVQNDIGTSYSLSAVINHYGSVTFGHYVSFVKNPYSGQWYKYDDQNREPINESQIPKENAYMMLYVRSDPSEADSVEFSPCEHCHEEDNAVTALKEKLGFKNLKGSNKGA